MTKVLLIQDVISKYRVPIFNLISKKYDFTVSYVNGEAPRDVDFKCIKVYKENMDYVYDYDILICAPNLQNINYLKTIKKFGRKKTIYYGIGVSASYKHQYDGNKIIGFVFSIFLKWIGASIFYCDYPVKKYTKFGVNPKKMFVANNTVEIKKIAVDNSKKENILFIGTLYKEKGIIQLLNSYKNVCLKNDTIPNLVVVGDGDERENIETFISSNKLDSKVILKGAIYDENILSEIFASSIACVSPNQAGLSVLKSMGYGVPFVTKRTSITGGELFNINNDNGLLYDNDSELDEILEDISNNKQKYYELGKNAFDYYYQHRTVDKMVDGFINAIGYIVEQNNN